MNDVPLQGHIAYKLPWPVISLVSHNKKQIEQPEKHAADQRDDEHRQRRLNRLFARRPYHLVELDARALNELPEHCPCSDVQRHDGRNSERHDHAESAQQRGRVREIVVADEPGQHDEDREGELRRIDERRLLFYFCFHAL